MKIRIVSVLVALIGIMSVGGNALAQGWGSFSITGSPESYVGQWGRTISLSSPTATFVDEAEGQIGRLSINIFLPSHEEDWQIDLASPDRTDFQVGMYLDTRCWPFQKDGHPGMDVSGNGRGNNLSDGWFEIKAFQRVNGIISHVDLEFYQHGTDYGDGRDSSEFGYLTYSVPEPAAQTLLGIGIALMLIYRRR